MDGDPIPFSPSASDADACLPEQADRCADAEAGIMLLFLSLVVLLPLVILLLLISVLSLLLVSLLSLVSLYQILTQPEAEPRGLYDPGRAGEEAIAL